MPSPELGRSTKTIPGASGLRRAVLASVLAALTAAPASAQTLRLAIDSHHSSVGFRVRHFFSRISGNFRDFEGTIEIDPADLAASRVSVTVKAASIDTWNQVLETGGVMVGDEVEVLLDIEAVPERP